jgi:hypothetical protein
MVTTLSPASALWAFDDGDVILARSADAVGDHVDAVWVVHLGRLTCPAEPRLNALMPYSFGLIT